MNRMRGRTLVFLAGVLVVTGAALWGCGGQQTSEQETTPTTETGTTPPGDTAGAGGEVSLAVGQQVFKERCETCHGPEGKGDGPAGMALNPRPRNFQDQGYMSGLTDQQIHDTILNGKAGTAMPPHQGLLTESQVRSVILVVRSFSR